MFTLVWTTCRLCRPEKVQVYVPECSSLPGLWSRRDPFPSRSRSGSSSAWPSHRLNVCLVLLSYLMITVGSPAVEKVQVTEKFWRFCGLVHGMDSAWPSSCFIFSEREAHFVLVFRNHPLYEHKKCMYLKCTLVFLRGSPHLGLVCRYEGAQVGVVGETLSSQRALHSEQTLDVCGFDGWIVQSLVRGRVCGPCYLRGGINAVRGASDRLIGHLHGNWLDEC